jgi:hypothetical protein
MEETNNDIMLSNLMTIKSNLQSMLNNIPTYEPLYNEIVMIMKNNTLDQVYYELTNLYNPQKFTIGTFNKFMQQFSGLLDMIMLHSKKIINNKLYIFMDMKFICRINNIVIDTEYDTTRNWYDYEIKNNFVQYFVYQNTQELPTILDLTISIGEEIIIIIDQNQYDNILEINMDVNTNIRRYYLVKQTDENNLSFQIFYPHFPYKSNHETINTLLKNIIHEKFTIIK